MGLRDRDWKPQYESLEEDNLLEEFYLPALRESESYDRVAGYFGSGALALAADGIQEFVENEGDIRLVTGAKLFQKDKPVLTGSDDLDEDTLKDILREDFNPPSPEKDSHRSRLAVLGWLLEHDRLQIKVGVPKKHSWSIVHSKLGIFQDANDNVLTFEGSINETSAGWVRNYESFKTHCSWKQGQDVYTETDQETFETLWKDEHPYVDIYPLPEAVEDDLIEWIQAETDDLDIEEHVEKARTTESSEHDFDEDAVKAAILKHGTHIPGGIHLAEEASTIQPWPHQRFVSDTLVNTYPHGFLLCDEVGLGKTIEIGLTMSRLMHTGEVESGLILAPASLTVQWQEELWEKFNLQAFRYSRNKRNEYVFHDAFGNQHRPPSRKEVLSELEGDELEDESWLDSPVWRFIHQRQKQGKPTLVLASWHMGRIQDNRSLFTGGEDSRKRSDVPVSARGRESRGRESVWDAVVVDEAHNARRGGMSKRFPDKAPNQLLEFLQELQPHTQCYYLLTATPMQIHPVEIYDLLSLAGLPEEWDDMRSFIRFFEIRQGLSDVFEEVQEGDEISAQATLEGDVQSTLEGTLPDTKIMASALAQSLELKDGAEAALEQVQEACELARAYHREYNGFPDDAEDRIENAGKEKKRLRQLLYPQEDYVGIVNDEKRATALSELGFEGWRDLDYVLKNCSPVRSLVHRNTRETLRLYRQQGLLTETVPQRSPENKYIDKGETQEAYDRIKEYVEDFYQESQKMGGGEANVIGFIMTTYRQRLTSSVYAITNSLEKRRKKLRRIQRKLEEGELEDVDEVDFRFDEIPGTDEEEQEVLEGGVEEAMFAESDRGHQLLQKEIDELDSFLDEISTIRSDPKLDQLEEDIRELMAAGHDRVAVFTQYLDTMQVVRDDLVKVFEDSVACYSGDGGEMYYPDEDEWRDVGKEKVKREFTQADGMIDILLCTDSASEGLNLQTCGALINYDLPWNPMRVEQRIGRVDRIGQEYDEIDIINYFYDDSVETDIYDALGERIGMFEEVVGTLQPILSAVEGHIKEVALEGESKSIDEIEEEMTSEESTGAGGVRSQLEATEMQPSALLRAWQNREHPDIVEPGEEDYPTEPPIPHDSIELIIREHGALENEGFRFRSADEVFDEVDGLEQDDLSKIYRVDLPEDITVSKRADSGDTIAGQIADEPDKVAATFDKEIADKYTSLRFLTIGDSLFRKMAQILWEDKHDTVPDGVAYGFGEEDIQEVHSPPWISCGWFHEENLALIENGEISLTEEFGGERLVEWTEEFYSNRVTYL